MKKSKIVLLSFLLGLIIFVPHNVRAAETKKCIYSNNEVITIHANNTAEATSGKISWDKWKEKTGSELVCPKYIIMANPIGVGNDLKQIKKYAEKEKVNYYSLLKIESDTGSYLGTIPDDGSDNGSVAWLIKKILNYIKIAGPVLVLILTSVDYLRALIQSDDETMAKINKKLGTRLLLIVLLFLIPTLVNVILTLVGYDTSNTKSFE